MYQQQQTAAYGGDGATKLNGPGVSAGWGAGPINSSFGGGAYCRGYGAGGYSGAAAFDCERMHDAGHNSMYGTDSMHAQPDARGMMGDMNGEIIVTKLFSSRRDLDHLASAQDFSRRFDSNWGSYRFAGAEGYGGSLYGANTAAGGSLMNLSGKPGTSSMMNGGTGAAGIGPDGNDGRSAHEKMPASGDKEAVTREAADERIDASRNVRRSGVADTDASKPPGKSTPSTMKPSSAADQSGKAHHAPIQSSTEASDTTSRSKDVSGGAPDKRPTTSTQQAAEPKPTQAGATDCCMAALQTAKGRAGKGARTMNAQETRPLATEPIDDIPLLADDVRPKPKSTALKEPAPSVVPLELPVKGEPQLTTAKMPAAKPSEPPNEATEAAHTVDSSSTINGEGRPARPRSRQAARPVSRLTSMSVVEFPVAEEVNDEMVDGGLHDPEKEAALRAEQRREREDAARAARDERQRQQQLIEGAQKQREEEAQRRRQKKEDEARQRKEMLTKMDEVHKRERDAAFAARERQREEEKRRFEDMKQLEEAKEAARAAALIAERQRKLEAEKTEAEEKTARSASRQRSRRPTSRPISRLRGAIPEQPPDVTAGQIKDTLADETLGKSTHSDNEGHHSHVAQAPRAAQADGKAEPVAEGRHTSKSPADVRCASSTPAEVREERAARSQRSQSPLLQQRQPASAGVMSEPPSNSTAPAPPSSNRTPQSQASKNSRRSQPKEDKSASAVGKSSASRPPNMVKTLVLVEELRDSNHALTMTDNSISYNGQTIEVTEVKTRPEDNFNYHSSVVHDVSEAVCSGYNAAVLAVDAPNTAGRFDSPVWSILNRIVRTLLHENSNKAGRLRSDFQLTCAMGYLYKDKVKDLLTSAELEAPFTKIGVNPSPIYGPRLTNLTYDAVTDPTVFEDVLTTTLSRASEDAAIQSLTEGVMAAFVLIMQTRETDDKPDIYLSSLVVATAGDDTFPYQSAISHTRNEYATVFHLVLGGPSCTCFMLNIADDDNIRKAGETEESMQQRIERVLGLLQKMSALPNYDLRSGSVKRFIKYVELSHTNAQARLDKEEDDVQRRKVERYLREQERLLQDAYRLLQEWNINCGEGL